MHQIKRSGFIMKKKWFGIVKSAQKGLDNRALYCLSEVGSAGISSLVEKRSVIGDFSKRAVRQFSSSVTYNSPLTSSKGNLRNPCSVRCLASKPTSSGQKQSQTQKEVSTIEDPFDAPTYNIPEKPVTFTEGASYSLVILAGLGIAGAAAYGVFKELIFQPKEYKIFNKALERIQNDSQVKARVGSPITGYGSESRNRAARQRIPHKTWNDEDGAEHIVVNFHIRGPHGAGKVFSEMFKDKTDNEWKFMYLIVELSSPSPAQLMLESYVPA